MVVYSTYAWQRNGVSLPANVAGSPVPLVGNNTKVFNLPLGSTLLRSRLVFQAYVLVEGAATGVPLQWWQDVIVIAALWWNNDSVIPTISPTPITDTDVTPDWVCSEQCLPTVDVYDVATPSESVSWRYPGGVIDVETKRAHKTTTAPTLWLAWEIVDPEGLINTTVGTQTHSLGINAWLACLTGTN